MNQILKGIAGGAVADDGLRGDLELAIGEFHLRSGALEEAWDHFAAAVDCVSDPGRRDHLASQLLLLARTCQRRDDPIAASVADQALRATGQLAPRIGLPALAQSLQRRGSILEAADAWREAIRVAPDETNSYLNLARMHERDGDAYRAADVYLELVGAVPSTRSYLTVAQRLDALAPAAGSRFPRTVKIALLGNATLDHLQSYLKVECYRAGLQPEVYQAGFDQYTQDILNPDSGLYAFAPDVVVLAIHASRLFPGIHHYPFDMSAVERSDEVDDGLRTIEGLLDVLTERTSALVLLHNMVAPQRPALGVLDWRDELGQAELFGQINAHLAHLVRERYRNVYMVDEDRLQARAGKASATDERLWFTARMGWSEGVLASLAHEYLRFLRPYLGLTRKCVVVDLDNTLWGGIVGEDGVAGVQLGPDAPGNAFVAFQRELERLWRRGVLLAICSKNNEDDALAVFERHPGMALTLSHFACRRIDWQPKAQNIREIAQELNIGLDSLVFLDDNPVERAKVRAELPQVLTVELPSDPARYRAVLADLGVFDTLALTEEDRQRNQQYAAQNARRAFATEYDASGGALEEYLAGLGMTVEIQPVTDDTLPRVAQLTAKTNQFNLTTKRYSETRLNEMSAGGYRIYSMRVVDRFGDNGIVGVAICDARDGAVWEIDSLLLSCRVMGRGVESALLAFLADEARRAGAARLLGWYLPTAKNTPARNVYRDHGFAAVEERADGSVRWEMSLEEQRIEVPGWLMVRMPLSVS